MNYKKYFIRAHLAAILIMINLIGQGPSLALKNSSSLKCRELFNYLTNKNSDTFNGLFEPYALGLQTACDLEDPCTAKIVHEEYWRNRGYTEPQGADPVRWGILHAACETKNKFIDPTIGFFNDLEKGFIPSVFGLKGKLSGEIKKIPALLDTAEKTIDTIPANFIAMYEKLALNVPVINKAREDLQAGQNKIEEMNTTIKNNRMIPENIKNSVLSALAKLSGTLPKINTTLTSLSSKIQSLVPLNSQETDAIKAAAIRQANDIQESVNKVKNTIHQKNSFNKSFVEIMSLVGDELEKRNL